jgi:hypothetical protein
LSDLLSDGRKNPIKPQEPMERRLSKKTGGTPRKTNFLRDIWTFIKSSLERVLDKFERKSFHVVGETE